MKILIINGPNLNMLGIREPEHYGRETYEDLIRKVDDYCAERGVDADFYQSNHEGALVDRIQQAYFDGTDGIVINPGAYTHTSIALLDAVNAVKIPTVEVHISAVEEREDFRQVSYIRAACIGTITGQGTDGYLRAVDLLLERTMELEICAGRARGEVVAPPSKSAAHRMLLCAGLAQGTSTIRNIALSEDIRATIDLLRSIGAEVRSDGFGTLKVHGTDILHAQCSNVISCRESGSTLRFGIPLLLLSGNPFTLTGQGRLMQRPQSVYEELCRTQGLRFEKADDRITLAGPLRPGDFEIPGDISSQFISGLLFALPLLDADSTIRLLPPVESRSYIDITLDALRAFGVQAEWTNGTTLFVPGRQRYLPRDVEVEGDWSNAAFFGALRALGDDVTVTGLRPDSLQGDRVYEPYFEALKAGCAELDISDCPDLGPILMATAAGLHGCVLTGTRRLAIKESDRGAAMAQELEKLGVACEIGENSILVSIGLRAPTEPLDGHNDHRIVMACAVLLTRVGGTITGAEAVKKSFPDFFDRLRGLGIEVNEHAAG